MPLDIPLDGIALESTATANALRIGWQSGKWLAVEFGYPDLGNSEVGGSQ